MCFVPRLNTERLANVLEESIRKENGELHLATKIFHTLQIKVFLLIHRKQRYVSLHEALTEIILGFSFSNDGLRGYFKLFKGWIRTSSNRHQICECHYSKWRLKSQTCTPKCILFKNYGTFMSK